MRRIIATKQEEMLTFINKVMVVSKRFTRIVNISLHQKGGLFGEGCTYFFSTHIIGRCFLLHPCRLQETEEMERSVIYIFHQ